MKVYDLSQPIEPAMQVYPGDPIFACHRVANVSEHGYNVTSLSLGSHTGTHIDAPFHFFGDKETVDRLPLDDLVGPAVVLLASTRGSLDPRQRITWKDLEDSDPTGVHALNEAKGRIRIVMIQTGWSTHWKTPQYLDHPFFDKDVATELLRRGVRVLGVDTLSPDETPTEGSEGNGDFGVHNVMLGGGAMIVENLTGLSNLPTGSLHVSLLPLKIQGCDGSPIRAVAWSSE